MWKYNNLFLYYFTGVFILVLYIGAVLFLGKIKNLGSKKLNLLSFSLTFVVIIICWFLNYNNLEWSLFAYSSIIPLITALSGSIMQKSLNMYNYLLLILSAIPTMLMWLALELKFKHSTKAS